MRLFLDIETRSAVDLKKTGQYVYAAHPSTEIIVVCYAIGDGAIRTWIPALDGTEIPADLAAALADPETRFVAHNASFERVVMSGAAGRRLGFPDLSDVKRWDCTAARAAYCCLPRTLEGAGAALGLDAQKDRDGHKLMLRMCKPRKPRKGEAALFLLWHDTPEQLRRLGAYCARDVEVERLIWRRLPDLSPIEREVWEMTERVNDRGIPVDVPLLTAILDLIAESEIRLNAEIADKTFGLVPRLSDSGALSRWLTGLGIDDHIDSVTEKASVAKAVVAAMIDSVDTDPTVKAVLMIRRDGGGSSVKKWRAILLRTSDDGRLRGSLVYCGAAGTGRWSSRGAQVQNMPRGGSIRSPMGAIRDILAGATFDEIAMIHGPPMVVASELLRPAFIAPPGKLMVRGDSSQIEARVNPWMAGAEWKLKAFREYDAGTGPDLYRVTAAGILTLLNGTRVDPAEVTGDQRQGLGKVPELSLGFGGGEGALASMAKVYGVHFTGPQQTKVKEAWRENNPEIVGFWKGFDKAAMECMNRAPGQVIPVRVWRKYYKPGDDKPSWAPWKETPISFIRNKSALAMRLPSGRNLIYWTPRIVQRPAPWGYSPTIVFRAEDSVTKRWMEFDGYGGSWCENGVQAAASDLMRYWLLQFEPNGIEPVLTVHDEGAGLTDETDRAKAAAVVDRIMRTVPPWAAGLPVSAETSAASRYIKKD